MRLSRLIALSALLSSPHVNAHGVWLAQRTGEWALVLGESGEDDAYAPAAIKTVLGLRVDGSLSPVILHPQRRNVTLDIPPPIVAVAVRFEDGYWSQDAQGQWLAGTKQETPLTRKSGYYQLYSHSILSAGYRADPNGIKHADFPLEIIPLQDVMKLRKGANLALSVRFNGRPLRGVRLHTDYLNAPQQWSAKTNTHGLVTIKVASAGLNVIKVTHNVPRLDQTQVDEDGYSTTLAFTLPPQD